MKTFYITIIIIASLMLFYQKTEPLLLIKELNSTMFMHTHESYNPTYIYNTNTTKNDTILIVIQNKIDNINIEYAINNNEEHIKQNKNILINFLVSTILLICINFIQIFLYEHEKNSIKNIIYIYAIISAIVFMYFIEITTNLILKKSINNTEILQNTQTNLNGVVVITFILSIIYYAWGVYITKRIKSIKKRIITKTIMIILSITLSILIVQYSIYECIIFITYAEMAQQLNNIHRCISKQENMRKL